MNSRTKNRPVKGLLIVPNEVDLDGATRAISESSNIPSLKSSHRVLIFVRLSSSYLAGYKYRAPLQRNNAKWGHRVFQAGRAIGGVTTMNQLARIIVNTILVPIDRNEIRRLMRHKSLSPFGFLGDLCLLSLTQSSG